jgi:hypothetical protein
MAIFSPGIASTLQQNYIVFDSFLSELATRLLTIDSEVTKKMGDSLAQLSIIQISHRKLLQ